jgi:hypothetical protein
MSPQSYDGDEAILAQIRELSGELSDVRAQRIVGRLVDAVALNPQPLPPVVGDMLFAVVDAVALNPQPLPPSPEPDSG